MPVCVGWCGCALKAPADKRLGLACGGCHMYYECSASTSASPPYLLQIGKDVRAAPLNVLSCPGQRKGMGRHTMKQTLARVGGVRCMLGTLGRHTFPGALQVGMRSQAPACLPEPGGTCLQPLGRPLAASFAVAVRSHA